MTRSRSRLSGSAGASTATMVFDRVRIRRLGGEAAIRLLVPGGGILQLQRFAGSDRLRRAGNFGLAESMTMTGRPLLRPGGDASGMTSCPRSLQATDKLSLGRRESMYGFSKQWRHIPDAQRGNFVPIRSNRRQLNVDDQAGLGHQPGLLYEFNAGTARAHLELAGEPRFRPPSFPTDSSGPLFRTRC